MKFLSVLYALFISVLILACLWLVSPYVIASPKLSLAILVTLLIAPICAGLRSMLELWLIMPIGKMLINERQVPALLLGVFIVSMIAAVAIPWLHGISGWNVWTWLTSLAFAAFNFETFNALFGGCRRMFDGM